MTDQLTQDQQLAALGRYEYGWADPDTAGASAQRGLSEAVVRGISGKKNEPANVALTARKVAELKGLDPEAFALTAARNTQALLSLKVSL